MYLVGADHPNKVLTLNLLDSVVRDQQRLVTDVEVFQEILHRYTAIHRHDAIEPAFNALRGLVDEVYAIDIEDVNRARLILRTESGISARDALHVAVMKRYAIHRIMSFDTGFDKIDTLIRLT